MGGERKEGLKLCFWNIAGIGNKNRDVWRYLESYDVVDSGGNIVGAEVGGEIKK